MPVSRLSAAVLLACGAFGLSGLAAKARASSAVKCPKLLVIGSRGSGVAAGSSAWGQGLGLPSLAFGQALQSSIGAQDVQLAYNPYEAAGIVPSLGEIVRALGLNLFNLTAELRVVRELLNGIGALARAPGIIGAYHASVMQGEADLRRIIDSYAYGACASSTKLVLSGYSQGAQVTGNVYQSLNPAEKRVVLAVVLFGDPRYNPFDTSDRFGYNDTNLLERWTFNQGILGHRAAFNSHSVLSFCHRGDPVCQGAGQFIHLFRQHDNYNRFGEPELAAKYVSRLFGSVPTPPASPNKWPLTRDDRLPFWASGAVAFTPEWGSCNKHWCLLGEDMGDGTYWAWVVRVDVDPTQTGTAYMLGTVTSPSKPPARKTLAAAKMKAETDSDCSPPSGGWYCPTYTFSARDMDQLLSR